MIVAIGLCNSNADRITFYLWKLMYEFTKVVLFKISFINHFPLILYLDLEIRDCFWLITTYLPFHNRCLTRYPKETIKSRIKGTFHTADVLCFPPLELNPRLSFSHTRTPLVGSAILNIAVDPVNHI